MLRPEAKRRPSPLRDPGASTYYSRRPHSSRNAIERNVTRSPFVTHRRRSLGGILFALAITGAFYGIHVLYAVLIAHPLLIAACLGGVVVYAVVGARKAVRP